jgi:hypothetical protein
MPRAAEVSWWTTTESDLGEIVETRIEKATGEVRLRAGVTTVHCKYDAVEVAEGKEFRWLRCSSPAWYAHTIAACATTTFVPGGSAAEDVERASARIDHSILLLKGEDDVQFGVGLRCVTEQ